ncbi:hypothetical protein U9M48_000253 [Paspalum notatum var. saurae]|uniref:Uncharacterized protein n=1 Tax=Paspalum notatum var. saurae TaxID=547442 RepID=A0AAQ3PK00_PASNO
MSQLGAGGHMTSLSTLLLRDVKVDGNIQAELEHHMSSLTKLSLDRCVGFFSQPPPSLRAPPEAAMWACFGHQLQSLAISSCNELVYWPEKEFQSLLSLRRLDIWSCDSLIGYAPPPDDHQQQRATSSSESQRSQLLLPRLEFLRIYGCGSLGQYLTIHKCERLSEVLSLPSSLSGQLDALRELTIWDCPELRSLESCMIQLPALEEFNLLDCKRLASLPSGPQDYPSLRRLIIKDCPGIKSLPRALRQRLEGLDQKYLDAHHHQGVCLDG